MRLLLRFIFLFFLLLIRIEDIMRFAGSFLSKIANPFSRISLLPKKRGRGRPRKAPPPVFKRLSFQSFIPFRKNGHEKKRRQHDVFFSFRTKVKYFFFGVGFSFFFLFLPIVVAIFVQDLPSPKGLSIREIPQTTKIYDRHDTLLAEVYSNQNRTLIKLSDIPLHLQEATLSIEDKNFYKHPGFDIPSILRAFHVDLQGGSIQGGSTITQQLIKSSMLTPERKISRKIKEVMLAFWAERIYSKEEILEMYFNQVPYGGLAWGIEAASETYFGKSVKQLTLAESAFLAGLTSAPSYYSPYGNYPDAWKGRQKDVLGRMVALGYITKKESEAAQKEKLHFNTLRTSIHAPHFVQYVKDLLIDKYGLAAVEKGGLQVKTSLDLNIQEMAEKVVADEVAKAKPLDLTNGAAVVTDPKTGDILAMVGSHDFDDPNGGNVNLATSLRQPGSSIKVVTYAAALERGFTAASMLDDTPVTFPGDYPYSPVNYDGRYHGQVTLRAALANSYNIPVVKLLNQLGVEAMVTTAQDMGIKSWGDASQYGLSLTLGAGEVTMLDMATVYGTLANQGERIDTDPILRITDVRGNVFEQKMQTRGRQVISSATAFIISDILSDNNARASAFGFNTPLRIPGHTVSVKTGTTDNKRDNWTDGYTGNYVVIVWVGNNDNAPMSPTLASGITGAAPIWNRIMTNLVKKNKEPKPQAPSDIVTKRCNGKTEYFARGTESKATCSGGSTITNLQQ